MTDAIKYRRRAQVAEARVAELEALLQECTGAMMAAHGTGSVPGLANLGYEQRMLENDGEPVYADVCSETVQRIHEVLRDAIAKCQEVLK